MISFFILPALQNTDHEKSAADMYQENIKRSPSMHGVFKLLLQISSMRSLAVHRYKGSGNALLEWTRYAAPFKVLRNVFVIELAKYLPIRVKNALYRAIGIRIGKNVAVSYRAMFDILFPELIEIGDNSIIGYGCTIVAHEFLGREVRIGKVKIGRNVVVGLNSTILAGVEVGDNATISAMSLVNKNVPRGSFVGGIPARNLRQRRAYFVFGPKKGNYLYKHPMKV
jgi:acetyltransferase-like isoleucine patch superfamily enzyme